MNAQRSQLLVRYGRPSSSIERRYGSLQRPYPSINWGGVRPISGVSHVCPTRLYPYIQLSPRDTQKLSIFQFDQRSRLSKVWTPTGGIAPGENEGLNRVTFSEVSISNILYRCPLEACESWFFAAGA